jgi:hypothetical protein
MFQLGTAALSNMTLSNSLTDLGVLYGLARQVNNVDLDKITFIQLPVYDLDGKYAGRVAASPERSQELFDLIVNDQPLVLAEANPGKGAVVAEDSATATPTQTSTPNSDGTDKPVDEVATTDLPSWVRGTNAATTSCSN